MPVWYRNVEIGLNVGCLRKIEGLFIKSTGGGGRVNWITLHHIYASIFPEVVAKLGRLRPSLLLLLAPYSTSKK